MHNSEIDLPTQLSRAKGMSTASALEAARILLTSTKPIANEHQEAEYKGMPVVPVDNQLWAPGFGGVRGSSSSSAQAMSQLIRSVEIPLPKQIERPKLSSRNHSYAKRDDLKKRKAKLARATRKANRKRG